MLLFNTFFVYKPSGEVNCLIIEKSLFTFNHYNSKEEPMFFWAESFSLNSTIFIRELILISNFAGFRY